jgi:hypothetical protein
MKNKLKIYLTLASGFDIINESPSGGKRNAGH